MGGRASTDPHAVTHFGVKGMHWGVRKGQQSSVSPASRPSPSHQSEDSKRVQGHFATIEKHGTSALSNKELQEVVSRLNLHQQYSNLMNPNRGGGGGKKGSNPLATVDAGHDVVKKLLAYNETYGKIKAAKDSPGVDAIKKGFKAAKTGYKVYKTGKQASKAGAHAVKFVAKQVLK